MNLLVIDTATEACSVALTYNDSTFVRYEVCPQEHSQKLLPMVDAVMQEAGVTLAQLDGLGFGRGPGSFTGVRIATGMIQGLALGSNLLVAGISTLQAMAQQQIEQHGASCVAVAIDARMNEVYFAVYEAIDGKAALLVEEQVCPPDVVAAHCKGCEIDSFAGTGWEAYAPLTALLEGRSVVVSFPQAKYMLPLAQAAFAAGEAKSVNDIQPVYLRDTVTWKKLPGRE